MLRYRGKKLHRQAHPKIFVWSHTKRAEIEYFQEFKNHLKTPLLMPKKILFWKPQDLIERIVDWKSKNINEDDGDQVWCVFDVDDFYKSEPEKMIRAIKSAHSNNVKIAYINECFELWILLHFELPTAPITRGKQIEKRIQQAYKKNGLGEFEKNKPIFIDLLPYQSTALTHAAKLFTGSYDNVNWEKALSDKGNPSTSIHILIQEIKTLLEGQE